MIGGPDRGRPRAAGWIALAVLLGGCASSLAPFVQDENRASRSVNRVEVCYNSSTTTPEAVQKEAQAVCARQGHLARFREQRTLNCSLLQPASAIFECYDASADANTGAPGAELDATTPNQGLWGPGHLQRRFRVIDE